MSDVEPLANDAPAEGEPQATPAAAPAPPKAGMLRDPVVRWMTYVAIGLVILFLMTVVGALVTGVLTPSDERGPRTASERELMLATAKLKAAGSKGEAWAPYITALVANGDFGKARVALGRARASADLTATPQLDLAEARLLRAQKRYPQTIAAADKSMKGFLAQQAARKKASSETSAADEPVLLPENYYNAALVKAYACVALDRWKDAVAMFDLYLLRNPTASDILIDRGNAKAAMKDNSGAEKDFREALRFGPNNTEALTGLKRIGVAK